MATRAAPATGPDGFSKGRTVLILAVVVGCFAILWPKVFYPMFTASIYHGETDDQVCCDVISEKDANAYKIMTEICTNIIRQDTKPDSQAPLGPSPAPKSKPIRTSTAILCRNEILRTCGVDILVLLQENAAITKEYKESLSQLRSFNTSHCLKISYGVDFGEMGLPRMKKGPFSSPSKPEWQKSHATRATLPRRDGPPSPKRERKGDPFSHFATKDYRERSQARTSARPPSPRRRGRSRPLSPKRVRDDGNSDAY